MSGGATTVWTELSTRMAELEDLGHIAGLLGWDEQTGLPSAAGAERGRQVATIEAIQHQRLVDPALGDCIDRAKEGECSRAQRVMLERLARKRDRAVRVPERLVKELAEARSSALRAWAAAREADDFASFAPSLEHLIALTQRRVECLRTDEASAYDVLLDDFEPEMTHARLAPVFAELQRELAGVLDRIRGHQDARPTLPVPFPDEAQWRFTVSLLEPLGFSLERGRQDRSLHPFSESCGLNDVRLTTRIREDDPFDGIFSTIHEAGHGLYEQGFDPQHGGTPLAHAPSMGIHESQSRLWENHVARSRPFWSHFAPKFIEHFPACADVELDTLVRHINHVDPGYIRVDADEVTYNLHIIVRLEIESGLINGTLDVKDVPDAWAKAMYETLDLPRPSDRDGALQDIHWSAAAFGYFPSYTIGNLYAAQLMETFEKGDPSFWTQVENGDFSRLLAWLRENVHRKGHLDSAEDTIRAATGHGIQTGPFVRYLDQKYGTLLGY